MKRVPPLPGEEALYNWIGSVLGGAAKDHKDGKYLLLALDYKGSPPSGYARCESRGDVCGF